MDCGCLKDVFPLHHSHALSSEVSVERVVHDGIQGHPKTRLSAGVGVNLSSSLPSLTPCGSRRKLIVGPRCSPRRRMCCELGQFTGS
jgi:hypothetical protein